MKKRFLITLLAIVMVVGMIPALALMTSAADGTTLAPITGFEMGSDATAGILSWDAFPGAVKYKVTPNQGSSATVSTNSIDVYNRCYSHIPNYEYIYTVVALDANDNEISQQTVSDATFTFIPLSFSETSLDLSEVTESSTELVRDYLTFSGTFAYMVENGTKEALLYGYDAAGEMISVGVTQNDAVSELLEMEVEGAVTLRFNHRDSGCDTTSCATLIFHKTYTVAVDSAITNGTVTADKEEVAAGETVTLTVTPADGYVLDTLTVTDASDNPVTVTNNTFTMPEGGVNVSATFKTAAASLTTAGDTPVVTYYETLAEAITAAQSADGSTVKLLDKASLDSAIIIESGTFTIDLNGKIWESNSGVLRIGGTADVKITDGATGGMIKMTDSGSFVIAIYGSAKLEIAGVTVDGGQYHAAVDMSSSGATTTSKLTVSGNATLTTGGLLQLTLSVVL